MRLTPTSSSTSCEGSQLIYQSADGARTLDAGNGDLINSVFSTINLRLGGMKEEAPLAIDFLESGVCRSDLGEETARQFNLIRDALSQVPPSLAVFDQKDLNKKGPWSGNLSPVVTSCAHLYTTSEGQDLLFEIVSILVYAGTVGGDIAKVD